MPDPASTLERSTTLADLPLVVRSMAVVGVPSLVACFLVYTLSTDVKATVMQTERNTVTTQQSLSEHVNRMEQMGDMRDAQMQEIRDLMRIQERYLRLICANTAQSAEDSRRCLESQ